MNIRQRTTIFMLTSIASSCWGMEQNKQLFVTSEKINQEKDRFISFLDTKNVEYKQLAKVTDLPILGSVISWGIETITPWTRYGKIEPEKSKKFLGRAFSKPETLKAAVEHLAQSKDNITYLNIVLNDMSPTDLANKDLGQLAKAMQGKHHPGVENSDQMDTKNNEGEYIIPDDQFYPFAVANLYAAYLVDNGLCVVENQQKKRRNSLKKRHSQDT